MNCLPKRVPVSHETIIFIVHFNQYPMTTINKWIPGLFFLLICFPACKQAAKEGTPPLSVKILEFKATAGDCINPEVPCYEMHLQYPRVEGGSEAIRSKINANLNDTVLQTFAGFAPEEMGPFNTLHDVAFAIETVFNDFISEFEDHSQQWFITMTSETLFNHPSLLSLSLQVESYAGGAHGNHWTEMLSFDPATGSVISWQEVITDPVAFLNLSEMAFRKTRDIPASANLEEAGFFFLDGQFVLPENIGFTEEGILFVFNPYEAGPYVLGSTVYTIPWEDIQSILSQQYQGLAL